MKKKVNGCLVHPSKRMWMTKSKNILTRRRVLRKILQKSRPGNVPNVNRARVCVNHATRIYVYLYRSCVHKVMKISGRKRVPMPPYFEINMRAIQGRRWSMVAAHLGNFVVRFVLFCCRAPRVCRSRGAAAPCSRRL